MRMLNWLLTPSPWRRPADPPDVAASELGREVAELQRLRDALQRAARELNDAGSPRQETKIRLISRRAASGD